MTTPIVAVLAITCSATATVMLTKIYRKYLSHPKTAAETENPQLVTKVRKLLGVNWLSLGLENILNDIREIGFTNCDSLAILLSKLLRLNNEKLQLGWSKFEKQCKAAAVRHNGQTSFPREKEQAITVSLLSFID